ncbi:MAG: L-threonylcarbamoyladenylate synthase [Ardenticatenaceae bacterium]|nr:L-threonylcarbamoyladenylate synthase [Ardenticatenaceae bacterium]
MITQIKRINPKVPESEVIEQAAAVINAGRLVAFPTETVYGLGADALNEAAVKKIFAAKERPFHDPIIVHIADAADLPRLANPVPQIAYNLAAAFWPGPLTLILPRTSLVPDVITAGGPTVAVRCPAHPVAQALIAAAGTPIGAPSANRFSRTSPTTAQHVYEDLRGRVDIILDGGSTPVGVESTVLDLTREPPLVLRPGGVPLEALRAILGDGLWVMGNGAEVEGYKAEGALPSPGMMDRHYAPRTPLWLFDGPDTLVRPAMLEARRKALVAGQRVALMAAAEDEPFFPAEQLYIVGSLTNLEGAAQNLFRTMRAIDRAGIDLILCRNFPAVGLGAAIRDRLRRAAEKQLTITNY